MRTMKFLFCAACLCSAGVFARTAMTQKTSIGEPGLPVKDRGAKALLPPSEAGSETSEPSPDESPFFQDADEDGFIDDSPARRPDSAPPGTPPTGDKAPIVGIFPNDQQDASRSNRVPMRPITVPRTVTEVRYVPIPIEELKAMQKLQAAVQSLRTGKDDDARKASADVIQQQLTTQFESDLKQREKELAEVEHRVKTLREQLDKRKASQAVIINLRLQTLVNEANGLGFPDPNFRADAKSAPTLFIDDLDRAVSSPRQLPQVRQLDPGP